MVDINLLKRILSLKKGEYRHLNKIEISRRSLEHNYLALTNLHRQVKVAPVLKSNAYGHGLVLTAEVFKEHNPPFLIVDSLYEAYELYKKNIKTPILIIGYTSSNNFSVKKLPFHYAVSDIETVRALSKYQPGCKIHLFVDTGLSREGLPLQDMVSFLDDFKKIDNVEISGLCSHLAEAERDDINKEQVKKFKEVLRLLHQYQIEPQWRHISASTGAFNIDDSTFNLIRSGLALYGIGHAGLLPALTFTSTIVQKKTLMPGDRIGYNGTYVVKKPMVIGLIPAGYYEGIDRRLSNKGFVKIGNQYCPIIGAVSMNLTTVDLTKASDTKVGDRCVIYSNITDDKNSIAASAEIIDSIPYELLVSIAESVKRVLV